MQRFPRLPVDAGRGADRRRRCREHARRARGAPYLARLRWPPPGSRSLVTPAGPPARDRGSARSTSRRTARSIPKPTPTMGGLAMYVGFLAALGALAVPPVLRRRERGEPRADGRARRTCTLMVGLGRSTTRGSSRPREARRADLHRRASGAPRRAARCTSASRGRAIVVAVRRPGGPRSRSLWIVAVANAVNLVDGLDGLAAGMVAIAAVAFFVYMVRSPSLFGDASQAALLVGDHRRASASGSCPGTSTRRRSSWGTPGSMLLGHAAGDRHDLGRRAATRIPPERRRPRRDRHPRRSCRCWSWRSRSWTSLLAIIRRTRRGVGIGHADKEHIHHRLMDIGHGHRQAVLLMYLWSALISGCALAIGLINGRFVVGHHPVRRPRSLFVGHGAPALVGRRNGNGERVRGRREPARTPGTRAGPVRPPGPAASVQPG